MGLLSRGAANSRQGSGFVYATAFYVKSDEDNQELIFKVYAMVGRRIIEIDQAYRMPAGSSASEAAQKYADEVYSKLPKI